MTLKELREAINAIDTKHDNMQVQCWLPGSYIRLNKPFVSGQKKVLMEGNVEPDW